MKNHFFLDDPDRFLKFKSRPSDYADFYPIQTFNRSSHWGGLVVVLVIVASIFAAAALKHFGA